MYAWKKMIYWFQWVCLIPSTDVRVWLCWTDTACLTDWHQVIHVAPRMPLVQTQRDLGLVSDGSKCSLLFCDFSPAKCTPLTNELTDHMPLKKETVRRNVGGLLKETRESVLYVKELMTKWIMTFWKERSTSTLMTLFSRKRPPKDNPMRCS